MSGVTNMYSGGVVQLTVCPECKEVIKDKCYNVACSIGLHNTSQSDSGYMTFTCTIGK